MDQGCSKLGVDSDNDIGDFVEKYIHCGIPEDEELADLVCKVKKHRHSATCRRHGHCRFHYPRPPSPVTVVARESNHSEKSEQLTASLLAVRKVLDDNDTACDISLDDLLRKTEISRDTYIQALKICSKSNSIVMKRSPSQCWINTYNPDVLRAWKGNMDIQYILDPYACVMYITSYMLKSERGMSELLKQVSKECRGGGYQGPAKTTGGSFPQPS